MTETAERAGSGGLAWLREQRTKCKPYSMDYANTSLWGMGWVVEVRRIRRRTDWV